MHSKSKTLFDNKSSLDHQSIKIEHKDDPHSDNAGDINLKVESKSNQISSEMQTNNNDLQIKTSKNTPSKKLNRRKNKSPMKNREARRLTMQQIHHKNIDVSGPGTPVQDSYQCVKDYVVNRDILQEINENT